MAKKNNKPAAKPTAKPKANPMGNPATDQFKAIVKAYLDKRAEQDELFRATYSKPNKSIEECCKYIIGEVYKANKIGHANAEIFGLAVHYYDEDDIKITPLPANCGVGIAHTMGEDNRPMRTAPPKPTPSKGKGASKPTTPQKPTTTPPKSTTPTATTKPTDKPADKGGYVASLFDLWQK